MQIHVCQATFQNIATVKTKASTILYYNTTFLARCVVFKHPLYEWTVSQSMIDLNTKKALRKNDL